RRASSVRNAGPTLGLRPSTLDPRRSTLDRPPIMLLLTCHQVSPLLENAGPGATVHLIGAGGCGMSGLGHLLLDLGLHVTGSDLVANEDTRALQARGAQ